MGSVVTNRWELCSQDGLVLGLGLDEEAGRRPKMMRCEQESFLERWEGLLGRRKRAEDLGRAMNMLVNCGIVFRFHPASLGGGSG